MDSGVDINEFVEMVKLQNNNLNIILEKELFLDRALLMLSMATAVDCMDWSDKEEAIDICVESIKSVTAFAVSTKNMWKESPNILVFGGNLEPEQDDWNEMFMEGQAIFRDMLRSHIDAYGQDQIEHAYKETTLCLTYMISVGCARSSDSDAAMNFSIEMIKKTFEFIKEHCQLKEIKE